MEKRGLSGVITTILLILLVIGCMLIVYVVIVNTVQKGVNDADISPMNILLETSSTPLSLQLIDVSVSRSAGEGNLKGVKVIFKNSAGATVCSYENKTVGMKELETVVYVINMTEIKCPSVSDYDVYPIINSGGKDIYGLEAVHSGRVIPSRITAGCANAADCNDNDACTNDVCANGACVNTPHPCGYGAEGFDGCCPSGCTNSNDRECPVTPPTCTDVDRDGYNISATGCGVVDCDDASAAIHHGATEICDGVDNNCVNGIDEGCPCTSYSCLTQRAIFYLPFDDNLNNLGTSSVTAEMRNLSGVDAGMHSYVTGLNNNAINFKRSSDAGDGDYVTTVGADGCLFRNLSCGTKTVSFWIKTLGQPSFSNRAMITGTMYVDHSASTGGWSIGMNQIADVSDGSKLTLEVSSLPSNQKLSFFLPNSNNWVNVVAIVNNTKVSLYKNAVLVDSLSDYGGFNPTIRYARNDLAIGTSYPISWLYGYNGSIDEFMVFNYPLAPGEINLLYSN